MLDLFVSYASEDREYVTDIVASLETQGWSVWWDQRIKSGERFDSEIEKALDDSHCIVVVWSKASIASEWVRAEATEGFERNILVQILLDDVRPPLLFRQRQAISLADWKNSGKDKTLLSEIIPSIQQTLQEDRDSDLPISLQKSWVLATVKDETAEKIGVGIYEIARHVLNYFNDVFIYPSEAGDDLHRLVVDEGLDGIIQFVTKGDHDKYYISIELQGSTQDDVVFINRDVSPSNLLKCTADLLAKASEKLGEDGDFYDERIHAFLDDKDLDIFRQISQYREHQRRCDWIELKNSIENLILDKSVPAGAFYTYGLACRYLGQVEASKSAMKRAVKDLSLESEIETHLTRGLYHFIVTGDTEKAAKEYRQVLKHSPMDGAALNNLAVCSFSLMDFRKAKEFGERGRQLYPLQTARLENVALFAFYAGDFDEALGLLQACRGEYPLVIAAIIPALVTALINGPTAALPEIESLEPTAFVNAAKIDLLAAAGEKELAIRALDDAIQFDLDSENLEHAARKYLMKAELSDDEHVETYLGKALDFSASTETLACASLLFLDYRGEGLDNIASRLKRQVDHKGRAYAKMVEGIQLYNKGELGEALSTLESSLELRDLWLIRFCMGSIYQKEELDLDAYDQFKICERRSGEGCYALLDDIPTFRYLNLVKSNLSGSGKLASPS